MTHQTENGDRRNMAKRFETSRLIMRPLEMKDLSGLEKLILSDPDVMRYYSFPRPAVDTSKPMEYLAFRIMEARFSDFHAWAIQRKSDGQFLGIVRLEAYLNRYNRFWSDPTPRFNEVEVELVCALGKQFWGNGFAHEASKVVVEYAFNELKIPRLVGGAHKNNPRAARLQERLGYSVEVNSKDGSFASMLHARNYFPEKIVQPKIPKG
ncbi:MAG: GNAT family N-acetyltransferase [SAR202 cluster bacterium]|nr:GNAT family N-acetyltransferase [SAR202 cluster bacterium]